MIYKTGENAEKTQKANVDILMLIEKRIEDITGVITDIRDSLLEDDTDPDPLNPEQISPYLKET